MKQRYAHIGLARLCDVFGKSRQTYYERIATNEKRQMEIQIVVRKKMPRIGGLKLHYLLKDEMKAHGIKVGRDKFFTLLRADSYREERKKNKVSYD